MRHEQSSVGSIAAFAGITWLLGMMAMLSLLLYQYVRIHLKSKRSHVLADEELLKSFWDACEDCGIRRRIPLLITTELKSPVIFGLLRPKVILPQQTVDRLSQTELKAVVVHELCHLKRFDLWVNWLQAILLAVYWFHPLVWLTVSRLRSLREVIVDDLVLHHLEGKSGVYGSSLLNVLQDCADRRFVAPGYVGIAENGTGLQQRVRRILDERRSLQLKIGIASAGLIALVALVFIPQGKTESPSTDTIVPKEARVAKQETNDTGMTTRHMDIQQPTFYTSNQGMIKGALDYYGIAVSAPTVFGGTGHGFFINVTYEIGAEGPHVWDFEGPIHLIENLGLRLVNLGSFTGPFSWGNTSQEERSEIEKKLREALDSGMVCALHTGVDQLITGYDGTGFFTTSPHSHPSRLTFGSWQELRRGFAFFYLLEKVEPRDRLTIILDSLDYAVELYTNPSRHGDGAGPDKAYTNWINGIDSVGAHLGSRADPEQYGGKGHGNWINGHIWSECRFMLSRYFAEIASEYDQVSESALQLQKDYADIAAALYTLRDRGMDRQKKIDLLTETRAKEISAIARVKELAALLRADQDG